MPYTNGVTKLPWAMLNTTVNTSIRTMSDVSPTAIATSSARAVARRLPTYGMNPKKNPITAMGSASGRPRTTIIRPLVMPPNAEMIAVPYM